MELVVIFFVLMVCVVVWDARRERESTPSQIGLVDNGSVETNEMPFEASSMDEAVPSLRESLQEIVNFAETASEIDRELAQLKLMRKAFQLSRKEVARSHRVVRANHTHQVRKQLPKFPGGGEFGRSVRFVQTVARAQNRHQLAETLAPGTMAIDDIDRALLDLDWSILELKRKRLELDGQL